MLKDRGKMCKNLPLLCVIFFQFMVKNYTLILSKVLVKWKYREEFNDFRGGTHGKDSQNAHS